MESGVVVRRRSYVLVALALFGGACGGGDDDDGAEKASGTVNSPIAELLGYSTDPSDQKAQQQQFIEQERKVQEAVADCMKKEGFEYTPMDPSQFAGAGPFSDDIPFDSKEWAEKYGFGMSTTIGENGPFGREEPGNAPQDPNAKYVESLSEGEREAYQKALFGEQPEFDPTETESSGPINFQPSGCEGNARKTADKGQAFYTEFGEEMNDLYQSIESDPQIVAASKTWATCMKKAGYEYETPQAMYEDANTKVQEFYGGPDGPAVTIAAGGASATPASAPDDEAPSGGPPARPEIDQKKLAEVQAWEKKVAVANWECSKDLNDVRREVQAKREQDFIDKNRAKIDELLADSGS